jgi:hypothetical protein
VSGPAPPMVWIKIGSISVGRVCARRADEVNSLTLWFFFFVVLPHRYIDKISRLSFNEKIITFKTPNPT